MEKQHASLLFASFQKGEEQGFTHYFRLYYSSLCFFAQRYVPSVPVAEDIVTDAYLRVWEKRNAIEHSAAIKNYLYKSVYHGCLNWIASEQVRKRHALQCPPADADDNLYFTRIVQAEVLAALHAAIDSLPTECRKVFTKLYIEGKSVRETAGELEVAISTVKAQKARGLRLLRLRLGNLFFFVCGF